MAVDTSRHFENTLGEPDLTMVLFDQDDEQLYKDISTPIRSFITGQLRILRRKYDYRDCSVYTGTSGLVLLAQKLLSANESEWNPLLSFHEELLSKMNLENRSSTFFCGDAGPLVVHILHCHSKGDHNTVKQYVDELLKFSVWSQKKKMDNEMLYGRVGYLYALLVVKQLQTELIPAAVIQQVVTDVIKAGVDGASANTRKKSALPLFYQWYNEEYIGAAHGYIGIFFMILQAKVICPGSVSEQQEKLVLESMDALLTLRFPSGNLPPCVGDADDRLMHWCHGAPGAIHLYALAWKLYKKPSYLSACHDFADNIWNRGLLKRGYGLCHGVAGNGYGLLCMYQVTGDCQYLWKAIKFAEWCLSYGEHGCRTPDTPYSLFEGLAGTLYFLYDILRPRDAMFPAFQLVHYYE